MQADTAQCTDQNVGHGGKPQAQLIGLHGGCRGAVGIEVELTFLNSVLHVAAGAVDLLIQILRLAFIASERGDHETGIGFSSRPLGLGHDPALPAPGSARHPYEALEVALHPAATSPFGSDYINLYLDLGDERLVLGQSEREVDAV
jgi:hypothetical protein